MFLAEIRDTASKFAQTISKILDVDVMIIDRNYTRVADTFRYVNDPPPLQPDSVTGRAITTGQVVVVSDKQKIQVCRDCSDQKECCIAQIIAVPIFFADAVVGAIDLLVPFGKESPVFENLELSIDFLERMADLLSSKLRNIDDYKKLDVIKKEREILLDFIEDALVYTNELGEIVHWNNQFAKLFGIDPNSAGKRIEQVLDHPMILAEVRNPRSFSNHEFRYSDGAREFSGFLSCRNVQRNGVKYGIMFNFKSMDKAYSTLNEISQSRNQVAFDMFRTFDPRMQEILAAAKRLAVTNESVLVTGAPGTGKSMLIRAIHDFSDRAAKPFIEINCRGFSPEYLEEKIFGREGPDGEPAPGCLLRLAQDGTVFFRHIEELPLYLQKRLTMAIKAKKLDEQNAVSARFVFSSDSEPIVLAKKRLFDEELAVRIAQHSIALPDLASRASDVPLIVDDCLGRYRRLLSLETPIPAALPKILHRQNWPGNIRQMERTIECLLSDPSLGGMSSSDLEDRVSLYTGGTYSVLPSLEEMEKKLIQQAISNCGNKDEAARALRIGRATLYRKLKYYGIA